MQLDDIVKYGKRSNELNGVKYNFIRLPYWVVKVEIANALEDGDLFAAVRAVVPDAVHSSDAYAFALWILDSYKAVIEMEMKALSSTPDKKLKEAGIEQMNIFGELNVINSLANGDILRYEQIKQLPYEDVVNKLLMDKTENEINKEYQRILSK